MENPLIIKSLPGRVAGYVWTESLQELEPVYCRVTLLTIAILDLASIHPRDRLMPYYFEQQHREVHHNPCTVFVITTNIETSEINN
eukprot:752060-Hanusia_phi.AAC.6